LLQAKKIPNPFTQASRGTQKEEKVLKITRGPTSGKKTLVPVVVGEKKSIAGKKQTYLPGAKKKKAQREGKRQGTNDVHPR